MFFRIKLESGKSFVGLVAADGSIMYRLVDVGRLLGRANPYSFAIKYKGRRAAQYIPESLHGHYNHMALRSDVVTGDDLKGILMKCCLDLDYRLTRLFEEGRVMLEGHCFNNYSVKYCMILKECQQGGEKLGDVLRAHKSRVMQFYRDSVQHCTHAMSVDALQDENTMPDNEGYDTNAAVGQEGNAGGDNGVKEEGVDEISGDNGESVQNNVPNSMEISAEGSENIAVKEESVQTDETNDARMEISVDGREQLVQTIYLPEERYKLEFYLRVASKRDV